MRISSHHFVMVSTMSSQKQGLTAQPKIKLHLTGHYDCDQPADISSPAPLLSTSLINFVIGAL